jgi:hypothetical protein
MKTRRMPTQVGCKYLDWINFRFSSCDLRPKPDFEVKRNLVLILELQEDPMITLEELCGPGSVENEKVG